MAIIQSKQSILSLCLLVAFIANLADAASLRGIEQADEAVSVDEKETSEGERDLQFFNPGAGVARRPDYFEPREDFAVDLDGNFVRGNFANNGGASRDRGFVRDPVPQPVGFFGNLRNRFCNFWGCQVQQSFYRQPDAFGPPATAFGPPATTFRPPPVYTASQFRPIRQPGDFGNFGGTPLVNNYYYPNQNGFVAPNQNNGFVNSFFAPTTNNFANRPFAYAQSNFRRAYAGGGGGSGFDSNIPFDDPTYDNLISF